MTLTGEKSEISKSSLSLLHCHCLYILTHPSTSLHLVPPSLSPRSFRLLISLLIFPAPYTKPELTLKPESNLRPGDEVALTCLAYGGYPEGSVIWQDESGRNLTDNITTSVVANEDGLFTMTSVLTVVLEPNSTYSCRLINPLLGEEVFAILTITGGSGSS